MGREGRDTALTMGSTARSNSLDSCLPATTRGGADSVSAGDRPNWPVTRSHDCQSAFLVLCSNIAHLKAISCASLHGRQISLSPAQLWRAASKCCKGLQLAGCCLPSAKVPALLHEAQHLLVAFQRQEVQPPSAELVVLLTQFSANMQL